VFPSIDGEFLVSSTADLFRADLATAELPVVFDGKHSFTFHACRRLGVKFPSNFKDERSRSHVSRLRNEEPTVLPLQHHVAHERHPFRQIATLARSASDYVAPAVDGRHVAITWLTLLEQSGHVAQVYVIANRPRANEER